MHHRLLLIGALAAAAACSSSPATPSSTSDTFHAEVSEAAGDAVVSTAFPTPPDLIHGTLSVGGDQLTVTLRFRSVSMTVHCGPATESQPTQDSKRSSVCSLAVSVTCVPEELGA